MLRPDTDFPDYCLRGIRKRDWITPEDKVAGLAFKPDLRTAEKRKDGGSETSINWEDNDGVVDFCLNPPKSGFEHGLVRLARSEIDRINKYPEPVDFLSYERDKLPADLYHGNIVFKRGLSRRLINTLAGSLAQRSTPVILE